MLEINSIGNTFVQQEYLKLDRCLKDIQEQIDSIEKNLNNLKKSYSNTCNQLSNLKKVLTEERVKPYAMYVDKFTAKEILELLIEDTGA